MAKPETLAEQVYDFVTGNQEAPAAEVGQYSFIENAFAEGTVCSLAQEEAWDARVRLLENSAEPGRAEGELENLFMQFARIQRELALRMFEYGRKTAEAGKNEKIS